MNPGFKLNDILLAERQVYDATNKVYSWQRIVGNVVAVDNVTGESSVEIVQGQNYITKDDSAKGVSFVRVGNTDPNSGRDAMIRFRVNDKDAPRIIIQNGINSIEKIEDVSTYRVVMGKLTPDLDTKLFPQGNAGWYDWGVYTDSFYGRGTFAFGEAKSISSGKGIWLHYDRTTKKSEFRIGDEKLVAEGGNGYIRYNETTSDFTVDLNKLQLRTPNFMLISNPAGTVDGIPVAETSVIKMGYADTFLTDLEGQSGGIWMGLDNEDSENVGWRARFGYAGAQRLEWTDTALKVYDNSNKIVFQSNADGAKVAGWTTTDTQFYNGTDMVIDSALKQISIANGSMKFGKDVATIETESYSGIVLDANNYWYTDGQKRFGNVNNYVSWNNTALSIKGNITADNLTIANDITLNHDLVIDSGGSIKSLNGDGVGYTVTNSGITGYGRISGVTVTTFSIPTDPAQKVRFSHGVIESVEWVLTTSAIIKTSANALIGGGTGTAGVVIYESGIYAGTAAQTTVNANFRLGTDGYLFATGATISGNITMTGGSISWSSTNKPLKDDLGNWTTYINGTGIYTGTLTANQINVVGIDASKITVGTLSADRLSVAQLNALNIEAATVNSNWIYTGSLTAYQINVSGINASNITVGTLSANRLSVTELNALNITAGSVSTNWLYAGNINASQISAGYINTARLNVTDLNAMNIQAGTVKTTWVYAGAIAATQITAGTLSGFTILGGSLNIGNGNFTVSNAGALYATSASISGTIISEAAHMYAEVSNGTVTLSNDPGYVVLSAADTFEGSVLTVNGIVVSTVGHGHTINDVTGLQSTLNSKATTAYLHSSGGTPSGSPSADNVTYYDSDNGRYYVNFGTGAWVRVQII